MNSIKTPFIPSILAILIALMMGCPNPSTPTVGDCPYHAVEK